MNRRDFLKVTAAGLTYATVMTNDGRICSFFRFDLVKIN